MKSLGLFSVAQVLVITLSSQVFAGPSEGSRYSGCGIILSIIDTSPQHDPAQKNERRAAFEQAAEARRQREAVQTADFMANAFPKMLAQMAEWGDNRILHVTAARNPEDGTRIASMKLPDTTEAGIARKPDGGNSFLIEGYESTLEGIAQVEYKGQVYKKITQFGEFFKTDFIFTPTGNSSDKAVIWLKASLDTVKIGNKTYTEVTVVTLPKSE